jgi:hypothetical protein
VTTLRKLRKARVEEVCSMIVVGLSG